MERPILCQKKGKLEMQLSKRKIQQPRQKINALDLGNVGAY